MVRAGVMRVAALACLTLVAGCATGVQRLGSELPTSAGPARTPCEQRSWLVVAPTQTEYADVGDRDTHTRRDALGLYRVGENSPESIPGLSGELPDSPMLQRHEDVVRRYDDKRLIAAGLGGAGLVAMAIGTIVFVNAFQTTKTTSSTGAVSEQHHISSGAAAVGGVLVGVGFGLGIGGLVVNPSQAEAARATALRYTFLPPDDNLDKVKKMVGQHNAQVKQRCEKSVTPTHPATP